MAQFKLHEMKLPLKGPVIIAVSAGVDSMVLAHLISKYGRRVVDPNEITLLHLDHGWRKESATLEKRVVEKLALDLGVKFIHEKLLTPKDSKLSRNLEEDARIKRNAVYERFAGSSKTSKYRFVMTAHHQDDVAETLLFRFFRGEFLEQMEGILFQDPPLLRPFLKVSKEEIRAYARAEKVPFYEDPSNLNEAQFRALCRLKLFPELLKHFPALPKTLSNYADRALKAKSRSKLDSRLIETIASMTSQMKVGTRVSLPNGLTLKRLKNGYFIEDLDRDDQLE